MKRYLLVLFIIGSVAFGVFFALAPDQADARGLVPCGGCSTDIDPVTGQCPLDEEEPPCNVCYLLVLVHNIIEFLLFPSPLNNNLAAVPLLAGLLIAVGGFLLLASLANPQNLARGRTILFAALIGILIIYGSWVSVNMLFDFFGVTTFTDTGNWWEIQCGNIPILNLSANPTTVFLGDSTELLWGTGGVSRCEASGDWSGDKETSCDPVCAEEVAPSAIGSYTYTLRCTGLAGGVRSSVSVDVVPYVFTTSTDFATGERIGVSTDNDQVELLGATEVLDFIWVAASARGTILKVNTVTGEVLGEYQSAPSGMGRNPSRTTVDNNGNVWAGNRGEISGGQGSVVHVGLQENAQCQDRDGNGVIDTSTGLGDILPWTNAGGADTNGGVSTADDECIIHYVRVDGTGVRTVAVDAGNNVWSGGHPASDFTYTGASTGNNLASFNVGCGGYGGLADGNGVLWSSGRSTHQLLRYDTNGTPADTADDTWQCLPANQTYGLGIDSTGNIWNAAWNTSTVRKFDSTGNLLGEFPSGLNGTSGPTSVAGGSRGLVVGQDDTVWVVNSRTNSVTRLDNDGNFIASVLVGSGPTGAAVDSNGFIWIINLNSDDMTQIDPSTNAEVQTVPLGAGAGPYNYSDMTGSTLTGAPDSGGWRTTVDSNRAGAQWGRVRWTATVPPGSSLTVSVEVSDDNATWSPLQPVGNDVPFSLAGRYLRVTVRFERSLSGESPVLEELEVFRTPPS